MTIFFLSLFLTTTGGMMSYCSGDECDIHDNRGHFSVNSFYSEEDEKRGTAFQQPPINEDKNKNFSDRRYEAILEKYGSVSLPLKNLSVSSWYGKRPSPFNNDASEVHRGIDLKAPKGSEVYAMFSGEVLQVSCDARSGKFITIRHQNYTISYCHLSQVVSRRGDYVKAGELVAFTGDSGRSTGPHLHLSCRYKGHHINPVLLLEYILTVRTETLKILQELLHTDTTFSGDCTLDAARSHRETYQ